MGLGIQLFSYHAVLQPGSGYGMHSYRISKAVNLADTVQVRN